MRKSPGRPRTPSRLSASLDRRLNFYALAASAAGVSLLALAQPSEAKIIYTKTHQVIGTNDVYPLDLTHDGTIDFIIQIRGLPNTSYNGLWAKEAFGNAVGGKVGQDGSHSASALKKGALIGPRQSFISTTGSLGSFGEVMAEVICSPDSGCRTFGQWVNVNNRYLGLKFQIAGKVHYGWARLSAQVQNLNITATLTGYAYETVPQKAIRAGQTSGTAAAAAESSEPTAAEPPGPAAPSGGPVSRTVSLGRLAIGARGLALWRRL